MTDTVAPPATTSSEPVAVFPWWLLLIQGIASVLIGLALFNKPYQTTVWIVYFIGWWWLISGVFDLVSLIWSRELWGWKVFSGILGIVAGGYIIEQKLVGTVIVVGTITLLLGINGMIIGVIDIVKAFQGAGWGKGILGVLSFIFGAIIAFNWTTFSAVMPWVWAFLAIGFGVAAIIMSFRVRKVTA